VTEPKTTPDAAGPTPALPPPAAPEKRPAVPGILWAAVVLALGLAVLTFVLSSRQIDQLRADVAALQEAQRELSGQAGGRRGPAGPAGQTLDMAGAPARGSADATVALIEYSDYECPFCIRHFRQTMPRIDQNYVQTGKIRYVFRDFPIDQLHPQAIRAHEASHCALEQQRFWELHPRLFTPAGTHTPAALEERAREAQLDEAAFRACIASGRTTRSIRESVQQVQALGATGTPWFFVGLRDPKTERVRVLRPLGGAQPYEQFALALDAALQDAGGN
jgi:protein-disulfide isomerase